MACCQDFRRFHAGGPDKPQAFVQQLDLVLAQVVYVVIRSFFKYLVCNIRGGVFDRSAYNEFFTYSLGFFVDKFAGYKGEFSKVHKIMVAKQLRLKSEP